MNESIIIELMDKEKMINLTKKVAINPHSILLKSQFPSLNSKEKSLEMIIMNVRIGLKITELHIFGNME
jgi:hypothetical protein